MRNTYIQQCDFGSRFRILKNGRIALVISAFLVSTTLSYAAPSGGVVTSGTATISQNGAITTINQATQKASINWTNFSIAPSETVNFNQPDISSITLNRVIGNEKSIINGALNANGQIWILNSNGVLFGKNASINTAGLIASTKTLSDADFQAGKYTFTGDSKASVINLGMIDIANNGYAALLANTVSNEGTIKVIKGTIELMGGDAFNINLNGNSLVNLTITKGVLDALVENKGALIANGGEIYLTTNAVNDLLKGVVNNTGVIEAQTLDDVAGKIKLFAHGGTAIVGGTLDASAPNGGDGGFIETSGKNIKFLDTRYITTASKYGNTGSWLIDPSNIYIVNGGTDGIGGSSMDADDIINALATNNLILTADYSIYIQEALNLTQNKLTLSAGEYLSVEAPVSLTGTAELAVKVKQNATVSQIIAAHNTEITAGNFIYNSQNNNVIAGALTVAPTARYTYQVGSDGTPTSLTGVLNNGKIRIGNGWYNSVGSNGMLEQPWYYDNVTNGRNGWYKLTYYNYHLDQAIGIGGDGTNVWNNNGDILHTDNRDTIYPNLLLKMTNISIDSSNVHDGVGTISAIITFVSDTYGQFQLTNSYELLSNVSFLKTTTSLKNESGHDASNVRLWVGTRDDYIAQSDSNYKTKGNIGTDGFKPITSQNEEAKAIIITEDTFTSGNGAAVLFYSTTANTNTIIESCCEFSNVIHKNPIDSAMNLDTSGKQDGSYGIFLSLGDLSNQQSKNLVWYYGAGPVSQLNNIVNEVGQAAKAKPKSNTPPPIISAIVNNTAVEQPRVVQQPVTPQQRDRYTQTPTYEHGGESITLASTAGDENANTLVSLSEIRQMQRTNSATSDTTQQNASGENTGVDASIRIPLSRGSLIDIVNGGVKLPENIEQEFYVLNQTQH